jgi:hypothetical protein
MLATDHTVAEFSLPQFDARALVRRAAPAALIAACAVAVVLLAGGRVNGFLDAIHRVLDVSPAGGSPGRRVEFSAGRYAAPLALARERHAASIGRERRAQITLAGAAATRPVPTPAPAVGAALWAGRAGLPIARDAMLSFRWILSRCSWKRLSPWRGARARGRPRRRRNGPSRRSRRRRAARDSPGGRSRAAPRSQR